MFPGFLTTGIALDVAVFADLEQRETSANRTSVTKVVWRIEVFRFFDFCCNFCSFSFLIGQLLGAFPVKDHDIVRQLAPRKAAGNDLGRFLGEGGWLGSGSISFASSEAIVRDIDFGQVITAEVRNGQFPEDVIKNRCCARNAVIAGDGPCRFEPGEHKGIDKFFQRHAVLKADGGCDREIVHQAPESGAFLVHVDEDFTQ